MPGQLGFKYVYSAKHINAVLGKLRDTGRPDKLTNTYMKDIWLLKDAKTSAVLDILKDMEFVDGNGIPTVLYAEYQNPSLSKKALAKGIKKAYPELFKAYPKAHNLEKETITGYFKQKTGVEKSVLDKIVTTFTTFCSLADFSTEAVPPSSVTESVIEEPKPSTNTLIPITMNIQIVIPSDATSEQYDRIFSSIKKFLTK
jgi:hypothetical protein